MRRTLTGLTLAAMLSGGAAMAQEPMSIVFTHHSSASNPFWQAVKKGFDDACDKIAAD
jgi:simple sugar transport system substrate-binding protein